MSDSGKTFRSIDERDLALIDRLREERDEARRQHAQALAELAQVRHMGNTVGEDYLRLRDENARLRAALEVYGVDWNWRLHDPIRKLYIWRPSGEPWGPAQKALTGPETKPEGCKNCDRGIHTPAGSGMTRPCPYCRPAKKEHCKQCGGDHSTDAHTVYPHLGPGEAKRG